jgi:tRNA pseudouridine38-40 synthase
VRTVQAEVEKALQKIHKTHTDVYGSGRTDSGVHAMGQAANFFSPIDSIPAENYVPALNAVLPHDIRVMKAREAPGNFSARFDATSRVYRYFMYCGQVPPATLMPYVWCIRHEPDITLLNNMAVCLKGETDCAAFAAAGDESLSTFRYLEKAVFYRQTAFPAVELLVFEIEANAFLWKMVRSVTGSLIECERSGKSAACFADILASGDRKRAGPTAPPQGLFLWEVKFDGIRRHR